MAGKSNKNKGKSKTATNHKYNGSDAEASLAKVSLHHNETDTSSGTQVGEVQTANLQIKNLSGQDAQVDRLTLATEKPSEKSEVGAQADGELRLYPIAVKGPSGENIELQVNPGDCVMDLRQFLLDAPETCFYTCYDLILITADGSKYQLADYYEIGDVADVTTGGCSLEMVNALYDDRSVRVHVRRTRDILCTVNIHSSLSTALALEYEARQQLGADAGGGVVSTSSDLKGKAPGGGTEKPDALELEGLGFMEDPTGHLEKLFQSPFGQEIRCVESIAFSAFNPPPGYRRLSGDLIYLDVSTLEGQLYCVTAHTKGFYVNSSSGMFLDPSHCSPMQEAFTLVGLLRQLSERFAKGLSEILERKSQCHPFEIVPSLGQLNPWLATYPPPPHRKDIARAEDALMLPYGMETVGMQRDWNEELQSCREFPRKSLQDRIIRDRALYKVNCDFVDAATKGAMGVIGRCIPPINPTDVERFHMYVHNNIFFSFAIDGDFALMQQRYEGNLKQSRCVCDKDTQRYGYSFKHKPSMEKKIGGEASSVLHTHGLHSSVTLSECNETSVAEADTIVSDAEPSHAIESEQATFASANNDLKGTKAYNNADIAGLHTLAMAIIDYRGHRIVAQSIIPGILQGDKSNSLVYGSVDNGKRISWSEKIHSKVVEAGKILHIKEHEVHDGSGNKIMIAGPVECKGIVGSDDRLYLLDLMRSTPRDANYMGAGSRHYLLRPELVAAFCQVEALERVRARKVCVKGIDEKAVLEQELAAILLNPNVFTDFKLGGLPEDIAADEELVRKAGKYLVDVVLHKFVQDLGSLEVSPMDGQTLTESLHAHGINIRYLGQVANLSKHLPHIWNLCIVEMIVRAAKHVLKGILRETLDHDIGAAIAYFLNCFFCYCPPKEITAMQLIKTEDNSADKGGGKSEKVRKKGKCGQQRKSVSPDLQDDASKQSEWKEGSSKVEHKVSSTINVDVAQPSYLCITSELAWIDIVDIVKFKYQFELPDHEKLNVKTISTIRNLCLKVGVTLASRRYNLKSEAPFQTSDILDLHAVVKHSVPMCADAQAMLESGKLRLAQGKVNEAYEQFSEAFSIIQQISGPIHREVANCCRYLAMVLYHAGDTAGAIMQQHKELIINERCLGLDHPDTAHSYGNMALFYHGLNQTDLALSHMARTLLLLNVSCGSEHPDVAATYINIAMMYQDAGRMHIALRYLQEALQKNIRLLGENHIQTAVCYHALAIAFNCMGAYKLSLQHEGSTYKILVNQLGEEDARTHDSANWLKTFQMRDMQKQKGQQAVTAAAAQKAADSLKACPDLLQALQAVGGGSIGRGSLSKVAAAAALLGDSLPRSRGIDERGARAAAEVRKKAVAKGLHVRPQVVHAQALSPLTEFLNLLNNDISSKPSINTSPSSISANSDEKDALHSIGDDGQSKATTEAENAGSNLIKEINPVPTEEQGTTASQRESEECLSKEKTPLGLGVGLGAPEGKKVRQKLENAVPLQF